MRDLSKGPQPKSCPEKWIAEKRTGLLNWKTGAVSAEHCEQIKRTRKISRAAGRDGSTMLLDSSGTCDGERRMAVGNALGLSARVPLKGCLT